MRKYEWRKRVAGRDPLAAEAARAGVQQQAVTEAEAGAAVRDGPDRAEETAAVDEEREPGEQSKKRVDGSCGSWKATTRS